MGGGSYVARVRYLCTGGGLLHLGVGLSFFSLSPHIYAYIRHFLLFCPLMGVHLPTEQAISIAPHILIPSPASRTITLSGSTDLEWVRGHFGRGLGSYLMIEVGTL